MKKLFTLFLGMALCGLSYAQQSARTATFEELELSAESFWIGRDQVGTKTFTSGDFLFTNNYDTAYGGYWGGFGYANLTAVDYDATAAYDRNSFTVPVGAGAESSKNYAVGYGSSYSPAIVKLAEGVGAQTLQGAYFICNATQINSIEKGDAFINAFTKGDFAVVVATGFLNGEKTAEINITLADFRFDDEADFYYLKDWKWYDLSALGKVDSITFSTHCNQMSEYGYENFPQYICIDNFNSAAPSSSNRALCAAPKARLYPVPARETLHIATSESGYKAELFNMSGRCVLSCENLPSQAALNVSALTDGMYLLRLTTAKGEVSTQKIVVSR